MKWLNGNRMRLVVVGIVATIVLGGGSVKADFTFGEPTNLGPTVNSSANDWAPCISADGLSLYFASARPGGYGGTYMGFDIWGTTRETTEGDWSTPVNVGLPVNSAFDETQPCLSADGLSLFFDSYNRVGGIGGTDLWVATRATVNDSWSEPVNFGPTVNTSSNDNAPSISADSLSLLFQSARAGVVGVVDLWVTTRPTRNHSWGEPMNLGPTVNSSSFDGFPDISADGLALFFMSERPGGFGGRDLWVSTRRMTNESWGTPINIGPTINTSAVEFSPDISADGYTIYFVSNRPGGSGAWDLWQAPIIPIVDLNADGIVDSADMCIIVDHWDTDEPLCDIGPMPWGDGIVDVQDLIVLAKHLFEEFPPVE